MDNDADQTSQLTGDQRYQDGTVTLVSLGGHGRIGGVSTATASYKGHRYPMEIINHCVWLYFRFPLRASSSYLGMLVAQSM